MDSTVIHQYKYTLCADQNRVNSISLLWNYFMIGSLEILPSICSYNRFPSLLCNTRDLFLWSNSNLLRTILKPSIPYPLLPHSSDHHSVFGWAFVLFFACLFLFLFFLASTFRGQYLSVCLSLAYFI